MRGTILDSQTGEPLRHVSVRIVEPSAGTVDVRTATNSTGEFTLPSLPGGVYRLSISTVGYRPFDKRVQVKTEEVLTLDLALSPDAFERNDTVEVHADPYDLDAELGPTAFGISGTEAKNLASVLAQDPLRAVQTIPGVTADDDFDSRFSLHGASYDRIGLYLDGILLHAPFHAVQGEGPSGWTASAATWWRR